MSGFLVREKKFLKIAKKGLQYVKHSFIIRVYLIVESAKRGKDKTMERTENIVAYVGTIIADIQGMNEDEIREVVIADIKLMNEDEAAFTRENLDEIVKEAVRELED